MAKRRKGERPTVHVLVGLIYPSGAVDLFTEPTTDDDPAFLAALREGGFTVIIDPLDERAAVAGTATSRASNDAA